MSPLYPCGKPFSTGTHNEKEKKANPILIIHQSNCDGIMASKLESRGNVIPSSSIEYMVNKFAITRIIHKSLNLIGTVGSSEFRPKYGQDFQSNVMSLCWPKCHHQVKGAQENKGLQIASLTLL